MTAIGRGTVKVLSFARPCDGLSRRQSKSAGDQPQRRRRERTSCWEHVVNVGDGKPDTGRDGSLPRAGAIKDRVNRAVDRLASLSRAENRMQLVGRPDQLGCLPLLTSEVAGRGRELWIWLILFAGGCPRGIPAWDRRTR